MNPSQNVKSIVAIGSQSIVGGTGAVGNAVDTRGFDYATFHIGVICATATSIPTSISIQQSDITDGTGFSAIAGFPITSNLPTAVNTSTAVTNAFAVIGVDTRARKRYLRLAIIGGTSANTTTAVAVLDNGEAAPIVAADAGSRYFTAV
jgi:predicted S18 family serine protease